jgi:GlpG protein
VREAAESMRQIGTMTDPADAKRFADYLLTLGITTRVDPSPQGPTVWVHREDRVPEAAEEFAAYQKNPRDPKYQAVASTAKKLRKEAEQSLREHEKKSIDLRNRWASERSFRRIPVTQILIAISIAVFVGTGGGSLRVPLTQELQFASIHPARSLDAPRDPWTLIHDRFESNVVNDLKRGEIWRPLTPIFLHFGLIHIFFNMGALVQLGAMVELRRGSLKLLLFVILSGLVSNAVQYFYTGSPLFGGMSGVIFAIFGYVWMKGIYAPELGMGLDRQTIGFMLIFLVVTSTGMLGIIQFANGAHLGGLVFGILVGIAPHLIPGVRGPDGVD